MSLFKPRKPTVEEILWRLAEKIEFLGNAVSTQTEWLRSHLGCVTKQDLKETEHKMAAAIENFATAVQTAFDKIDVAVDGIAGDVTELKRVIEELQNSPGAITPEDQALLDSIQARATALGDKVAALDEATPQA